MIKKGLTLKLVNNLFGVCRLEYNAEIPEWTHRGEFISITRTRDELSIVCLQKSIPEGIKFESDWRILKIEGPLDFSLIGILASISTILAEKEISIFAISTYDTDYILIKEDKINIAINALIDAGYYIIE
jgi:uncharacterized protein